MISSASSLFLATLVFNAALVWGAPVPVSSGGSPAVRSVGDDVFPRKMNIIDVVPHQRSVDPEQVAARDTAPSSSDSIEARDSLPEVERIVRRYPRRVHFDYYEKRSPSADDESSSPMARSEEVVERRFPRRALYERHEARSTPAPPEARADTEPSDVQRRYPRKVYADYYQKRESTPPSPVVAREPAPELDDSGRRFPRREAFEKRQDAATADPVVAPPAADAPAPTATVVPSVSASASATASASTATATSPNVVPLDINAIVKNIASTDAKGYQPGTTIKETTLLTHKITHVSDKGAAAADKKAPIASGTAPSSTSATPASSATAAASSSAAATPIVTPATGDAPATPATPDAAAAPPAAPADDAAPPAAAEGDASRRSLGSNIRRQLGYSGPAWASHLKRNVN